MRRLGPWLSAVLPAVLGICALALTALHLLPDLEVYLRADLGALAVLTGVGWSAALVAGMAAHRYGERARRRSIVQAQAAAAADRQRFLRRLDHELKNPLTAIHAGLANLAEAPAAAREGTVRSVTAQTVRLSRLAADLRKLADLETRPLEQAPVNLAELLEEAVALIRERPEAGERHLALTLPRAPWPLPWVQGDRDLLFLALHNLLDNALKFTRPADTVEVRAFEDGQQVVVEVADTGPGVAEEDLAHVWEELYRGQAARGVQGSGLGLALVRAVITRHHGAVYIRSRREQGTVITVRLPSYSAVVTKR